MATTTKTAKGIKITGEGKYPLVPLASIQIVERPDEGDETDQLFYNPRSLESFDPVTMAELVASVRTDGLQQPPQVRAFAEGKKIVKIELIAGERRIRTVSEIVKNDLPCYDEDATQPKKYRPGVTVVHKGRFGKVLSHKASGITIQMFDSWGTDLTDEQRDDLPPEEVYPTVPGSKLYQNIPCRVAYNCSDERALRLAFTENDKAKSLKTHEEIALVERLQRRGLKQGEISELLGSNETWVSQTLNFRTALPVAAFEKLVSGSMARHVAVSIMGYKPEDRDKLFQAAVEAEEKDTAARIEKLQDEQDRHEDEEEIAKAEAAKAEELGDQPTAKRNTRAAESSAKKAKTAQTRKERTENERGTVKQSHVATGAATAGVRTKKAKMLPKEQVQEFYIDGLAALEDGETDDPECGVPIPGTMVALVRATAQGFLDGERDPLAIIRGVMMTRGEWKPMVDESDPDAAFDDDEYEEEEFAEDSPSFDYDDDEDEEYNPMAELDRMGYDDMD